MASVSRSQLRTRARLRANQDGATKPSDDSYNIWLNECLQKVWYDLLGAGWVPEYQQATFVATGVTNQLAGGDSIATVLGVFWQCGGAYIELPRIQEGQRASLMSQGSGTPAGYRVFASATDGLAVEILPPSVGQTFVVNYIPEQLDMSTDLDAWRGPARADELIVLCTAAKAMRYEGNDQGAAQVDKEYYDLLPTVLAFASMLDGRNAPTIRDVGPTAGLGRPQRDPFDYDV